MAKAKWMKACDEFVDHIFALLQDPANQGPKFSNDTFDMSELTVATVNMCYARPLSDELDAKIAQRAKDRWHTNVKKLRVAQ